MSRSSPLRSIWFNPSQTVAYIAHENPGYRLFALPIISGLAVWPTVALFATDSDEIESGLILSTILAFGPIAEIFQVFVGAYLIRLTGIWIGGKARTASIQAAIVWGNVPIAVIAILGIVVLLFSSAYNEFSETPLTWNQSPLVTATAWLLFALQTVIVGWSIVIFFRGLAAVQGYSISRAILNAAIAWLVPAMLVVLVAIVSGYGEALPHLFLAGFHDLVMLNES
jgi:hypothetical protein